MNIYAKPGTKVVFIGCSNDQLRWGSHTGRPELLNVGGAYTVKRTEVHSSYTKVFLEETEGSFPSVSFD